MQLNMLLKILFDAMVVCQVDLLMYLYGMLQEEEGASRDPLINADLVTHICPRVRAVRGS